MAQTLLHRVGEAAGDERFAAPQWEVVRRPRQDLVVAEVEDRVDGETAELLFALLVDEEAARRGKSVDLLGAVDYVDIADAVRLPVDGRQMCQGLAHETGPGHRARSKPMLAIGKVTPYNVKSDWQCSRFEIVDIVWGQLRHGYQPAFPEGSRS